MNARMLIRANEYMDTSRSVYIGIYNMYIQLSTRKSYNSLTAQQWRFSDAFSLERARGRGRCYQTFGGNALIMPLIESTSPLRVNSIGGLDVLGHNRQMVGKTLVGAIRLTVHTNAGMCIRARTI